MSAPLVVRAWGGPDEPLSLTSKQVHVLMHAVGWDKLKPKQRRQPTLVKAKPFRNRFVAGPGHHRWDDVLHLVALGLMARGDYSLAPGDSFCWVTPLGWDALRLFVGGAS